MTAAEFTAWQTRMRLDRDATAKALGVNPRTVLRYESHGAPGYIAAAAANLEKLVTTDGR